MTPLAMIEVSSVDLVLRVAAATEGASEVPANTNSGPFVEPTLRLVGLKKGDPWCAAWLYRIGATALPGLWPLPATGGCAALDEFAVAHHVRMTKPERGDAFLIYHASLKRMGHVGLVLSVNADGSAETISGNTSGAGSREGWIVGKRTWHFAAEDRFIRWANLL